jgi:UDP-glucuronate 4-epimerase
VGLLEFVHTIERALGKRARKRFLPIPPGDVISTHAEVEDFFDYTGFYPTTSVAWGVERLVAWHRDYSSGDHAARGRRAMVV